MRFEHSLIAALLAISQSAFAYELFISSEDSFPQVCSGMYGGGDAAIEVLFSGQSTGELALVIYEFNDQHSLGSYSGYSTDSARKRRPRTFNH